jgi:hypothetical protein
VSAEPFVCQRRSDVTPLPLFTRRNEACRPSCRSDKILPVPQQTRIGISGWRYGPWRGTFYPKDLAQRRELEYASRQLNSIEINGTFYSLQRPNNFAEWYEQTPDDFVFALKGGRFITQSTNRPPLSAM